MSPHGPGRSARLVRTMGTVVSIDVRAPAGPAVDAALNAAEAVLHDADAEFSTYRPGSWISRLARRDVRAADLPPELREVFDLCAQVEGMTDGWFTARWRGDGTLDPTGLVKGWAAERASRLLSATGIGDHCINAAGDVTVAGRPASGRGWRIGVADPREPAALLGVIETRATETAIATSGTGERGMHIHDPRTGQPADAILSATVVGPSLAVADGLATALVAAGPAAGGLLARWRLGGWRGCILTAAGELLDPDNLVGAPPQRNRSGQVTLGSVSSAVNWFRTRS